MAADINESAGALIYEFPYNPYPAQFPVISAFAQVPAQHSIQFDRTGQVEPPRIKPHVTATFWKAEDCRVFEVEANGVLVARRGDNDMINGTKLLKAASVPRGRRAATLKGEKRKDVITSGKVQYRGVWIPLESALVIANKLEIKEYIYPLFDDDIASRYDEFEEQNRQSIGSAAMAADDRSRSDSSQTVQRHLAGPYTPQPSPLHYHNSWGIPIGVALSQHAHTYQASPFAGSKGSDQAHTSPTCPMSSTSTMEERGSFYKWDGANVKNATSDQSLPIYTALNNTRTTPATPAITPKGAMQQGMSYPSAQSYGVYGPIYSAYPSMPDWYSSQDQSGKYRNDGQYQRTETVPLPPIAPYNGVWSNSIDALNGALEAMHPNCSRIATEMTGSPHLNSSSCATPCMATTGQTCSSSHSTDQRPALGRSNFQYVMSNDPHANFYDNVSCTPFSVFSHYENQDYPILGYNSLGKHSRYNKNGDADRLDSIQSDDKVSLKKRRTAEESGINPYA